VSCGESLEKLDFSLNALRYHIDNGITASTVLKLITNVLNQVPNLKAFCLKSIPSSNAQIQQGLCHAINGLSKLETLTLKHLPFSYSLDGLKPIMKTLKHLDIDPVDASCEDVKNLLASSPKLRFLRLGLGITKRPPRFRKRMRKALNSHKAKNPDFLFMLL